MPLVSIITPSFNQAAFLEQTVQSVLLQEMDETFEIEYGVIDGASTDGSIEIIQRYAAQSFEFSAIGSGHLAQSSQFTAHGIDWWISESDRGQAEAINKGFRRARGEFVAWLNSDDLFLPGAVRKAVGVLQANPELGMVYGDAITIDASGYPLNKLSFGEWGLRELLGFRIICQPAVFMRRSVLESVAAQSGYLNLDYHFMLDHHLWLRVARQAPIQHIPLPLAAARQHAGAKNVRQAAGFSQETGRILEWMQTQPNLAAIFYANRRYILGGANRLQARYYLDGDQPVEALKYYTHALWYSPHYALKHYHRMIYALLCLVGAKKLADRILRPASAQRKRLSVPPELQAVKNWPGLNLS
jgi:glycosyltransferase involved in cell wall biosynthesis